MIYSGKKAEIALKNMKNVAQGSAVAITPTTAVTNCHVLVEGDFYVAKIDGTLRFFQLTYDDKDRDLCLINTEEPVLTPIKEFRRYTTLNIGEKVFTIGSPSGLGTL